MIFPNIRNFPKKFRECGPRLPVKRCWWVVGWDPVLLWEPLCSSNFQPHGLSCSQLCLMIFIPLTPTVAIWVRL